MDNFPAMRVALESGMLMVMSQNVQKVLVLQLQTKTLKLRKKEVQNKSLVIQNKNAPGNS